ncbi:DUF4743 domain-containing protein [Uruburuella testudinis]|uniref:DUF4743 domain-containing protein n=1 Tax=Uruburuella testudinis TaxID=1282863 RepID=A0ABY4DT23_9NEIS|nr:DUF4743 domain-containing protein [Uruburuella testudinis]UOO82189.1 DUF4743 domain-containing protein [Uruburuella testudinis]
MNGQIRFGLRLSETEHARLWARVQNHFAWNEREWQPLWLNGERLGLVSEKWRQLIRQDWQGGLDVRESGLALSADNWLAMADNLQNMAQGWNRLGVLEGWRNEKFDVADDSGRPLFALERAAFRPLGLLSNAIHINGLTCRNGEWRFWIGRRSPFKAVDPNKLDNLVGGGVSSGERIEEAMLREGAEEAGLLPPLLQGLDCRSCRLSMRRVSRGLHRERLHIFDVVLPPDVLPENQDGEVAEFMLMDCHELAAAMADGRLMNDALLATLDLFLRGGLLDEAHPLAQWLSTSADCRSLINF